MIESLDGRVKYIRGKGIAVNIEGSPLWRITDASDSDMVKHQLDMRGWCYTHQDSKFVRNVLTELRMNPDEHTDSSVFADGDRLFRLQGAMEGDGYGTYIEMPLDVADIIIADGTEILEVGAEQPPEQEPAIVDAIFRRTYGWPGCVIEWFRSFLSLGLASNMHNDHIVSLNTASGTGKGTLKRMISRVFKQWCVVIRQEEYDKHTSANIGGKRVMIVDEASHLSPQIAGMLREVMDDEFTGRPMNRPEIQMSFHGICLMFGVIAPSGLDMVQGDRRRYKFLHGSPTAILTSDPAFKESLTSDEEVRKFFWWLRWADPAWATQSCCEEDHIGRWTQQSQVTADRYAAWVRDNLWVENGQSVTLGQIYRAFSGRRQLREGPRQKLKAAIMDAGYELNEQYQNARYDFVMDATIEGAQQPMQ